MPSREIEDFIAHWSAASLAERVKVVNEALASVKQPVTAADVAKGFARVKDEDVGEILETLCTMGHARRGKAEGMFLP
jgi:hypothetical protein